MLDKLISWLTSDKKNEHSDRENESVTFVPDKEGTNQIGSKGACTAKAEP